MSDTAGQHIAADEVSATMSTLMPFLGPYWSRPLRDYAAAVYDCSAFTSKQPDRVFAMERLRETIRRAALRAGYGSLQADAAARQMLQAPVLQTGPHCLLLPEPDAFYTHLFSLLGLDGHPRDWHFTYFGSTMSFKEAAKKGPGWLSVDGTPLNVFGLSRARMDGSSICCVNGPYRFALTDATRKSAQTDAARRLLSELPLSPFPTAAEAIKAGNYSLWPSRISSSVNLLQLDDFDVADLIADHLDHDGSFLAEVFVRDGGANYLIEEIDRLNAGPWSGWIRRTTDYFWHVGPEHVVPLRLEGGRLRSAGGTGWAAEFEPAALAEALRQRRLLPNLFTAFLVLSILPGVRALGGCRQVVYLPLMRYLTALLTTRSGNRSFPDEMGRDAFPSVWGHRVLRGGGNHAFGDGETIAGVEDECRRYGEMPLGETSGDLASFTRDALWDELSRRVGSGTAGTCSLEWKWSGFDAVLTPTSNHDRLT
jgi:hypothetical protein